MKYSQKNRITRALFRALFFPFIKLVVRRDLSKLQNDINRRLATSDSDNINVAYIRSDFWLNGNSSNGAMAHTVGVVNSLKKLCNNISIFSITKLVYLSGDIEQIVISPKGLMLGISEIEEMEYSHYLATVLFERLKNNKPSFIYQRYGRNNYTGVLLANKLNIPCVIEYNGSELWMADNWGHQIHYRAITENIELSVFRAADLIVGNAEALKEELAKRGILEKKIIVIPNGVDINKFSPDITGKEIRDKLGYSEDTVVVTFVGSFGPWHGADVLARSIKLAVSKYANVKFLFVGSGGGLAQVKRIIEKDGVEKYVNLVGTVKQNLTPHYLAASDILVSPQIPNPDGTPFFGSPTKLFEYMAAGKAIIASDLDQMGKILTDNKTAMLVTPGKHEEIAEKIIYLAQNAEFRQILGNNARKEAVEKYTWDIHVQKIIDALAQSRKNI